MADVNNGIHMSGGTINAENIAVGKNARAGADEGGHDAPKADNVFNGDARNVVQAGQIDTVIYGKQDD